MKETSTEQTAEEVRERIEALEENLVRHEGTGNNRETLLQGQIIALKWVVGDD